jgi:creatinine amidohydrolase
MFKVSYDGKNKKVLWQEMWRHEFLEALEQDPVVIVPTGSIEQHGPHCPMDVDIAGPFYIAARTAQRVDDFPVIVAPPVHFGFTHYNKGFPGTISLKIETYLNLVGDVCRSIHANGFKRIVVINGHGGNNAPNHVVRDTIAEENVFVVAYSWWQSVTAEMLAWSEADEGSVGHGGEWETSVMLHLRECLISKSHMNDDLYVNPFSPELREFCGFSERRRDTRDVTGTMGSSSVASKEKGERIINLAVDRLEQMVREYHKQPVRDYRENGSHCP